MSNKEEQVVIDANSVFASFDTDYTPKTKKVPELKINDKEEQFLLVKVPVVDDIYISIIKDSEKNRDMMDKLNMTIVGTIKSKVSLPELLYALQHPTRDSYKASCGVLKYLIDSTYNDDDKNLRALFSSVK